MKCLECDVEVSCLYEDFSSPPLDIDLCLCIECSESTAITTIEDYENAINSIKESVEFNRINYQLKESSNV